MRLVTPGFLNEQLELADQLLAQRKTMLEPQNLPGRYGRVVKAVDHLLQITGTEAVLAGGWAVWRHGYIGRITQDIDIVLPSDRVQEFLRAASVSGFELLPQQAGRWPKLIHRDSGIQVDVLPQGERPGTPNKRARTTIPHPSEMGATGPSLSYISLTSLIELKLAVGRVRDEGDVVELVRVNPDQLGPIRQHLANVHADYVTAFDRLVERAREQDEE